MLPGINRLDYAGQYWPDNIVSVDSPDICSWLESVLWLVPLPSRPDGYDPLKVKAVTTQVVEKLAMASKQAWDAVVCAPGKCRADCRTPRRSQRMRVSSEKL